MLRGFVLGSTIDLSGINQVLDIILLVGGISFVVILLGCFLFGLLRGWKYGTYRLIFLGILIAACFLLVTPVAKAVGDVDLGGFNAKFTLTLNNKSYVLTLTNVNQSLRNLIYDFCDAYKVKQSPSELLAYSQALATSVLKLVTLFTMGIFVLIFGQLLCMLLWHIAFKRIIPKEKRKIKKLRPISAIEDLAIGLVVACMLIMPFTSVANALKNHFKVDDSELNGNETLLNINKLVNTYDNSIMSKIFFDWTKGTGEDSLDSQLMSFISKSNVDKVETDIIHEVSTLASTAQTIIKSGLLDTFDKDGGLKWYLLFSNTAIPNIINLVANLDIVKVVLPFAASVAINIDEVANIIGEQNVSYFNENSINWIGELENISKIYQDLLDSGVIDCIVNEDAYTKTPKFDTTNVYDVISTESGMNAIRACFADGRNSNVLNRLITGLVYNMASKEEVDESAITLGIRDFLPQNEDKTVSFDKMLELDWFREVRLIFEGFHDLNTVDPVKVKKIFSELPSELDIANIVDVPEKEGYINYGPFQVQKALLTDLVFDHPNEISDILVGEFNGTTPAIDDDGNSSNGSCLFDSDLLTYGMPKMLDVIEDISNQSVEDIKVDLQKVKSQLSNSKLGVQKVNFKKEYKSILNVVVDFASTDAGKAFCKDLENHPGLEFDPNGIVYDIQAPLVDSLMDGIVNVDNSLILSAALPSYIDTMLSSMKDNLKDFGLTEFQYPEGQLGSELSKLFSILKHCKNLLTSANSLNSINSIANFVKNYNNELVSLIDIVGQSEILNPENVQVGGVKYAKNYNLTQLINNLFSKVYGDGKVEFSVDEINAIPNLVTPIDVRGDYINQSKSADENTESFVIVDFLTGICSTPAVSRLSELTDESTPLANKVEIFNTISIEDLFEPIDNSQLLPKFMSTLLDDVFDGALELEKIELKGVVTFKNIVPGTWATEGKAFDEIIYAASHGIDLSNIDMMSVDSDLLGDVLRNLAKSGIFVKNDRYVFPQFMYNKMIMSFDEDTLLYLVDPIVTEEEARAAAQSKDIYQIQAVTTSLGEDILSLSEKSQWIGQNDQDKNCEIYKLCLAMNAMNSIGGEEGVMNFDYQSLPAFSDALSKINNCDSIGRLALYNGLKTAINDIDLNEIVGENSILVMEDANTLYLFNASKEERVAELEVMLDIFYRLYDPEYGLIQSDKGDTTFSVGNLDADSLLRPLLTTMYESKVFGTKSQIYVDHQIVTKEYSIFEELMMEFLARCGLYASDGVTKNYNEPLNEYTALSITTLVEEISKANAWVEEVDKICTLVSDLHNSPFIDSEGKFSFDILSDGDFYTGKQSRIDEVRECLSTILNDLNSSEALYRSLPDRLDSSISNLGDTGGDLNEIFQQADFFFTDNGLDGAQEDFGRYAESDVDNFMNAIFNLGKLSKTSFTNMGEVDFDSLTSGVAFMGQTGIFNHTKNEQGFTSFTSVVKKMIKIDALKDYFYLASSPKDIEYGNYYNDFESKIDYIILSVFGNCSYDSEEIKPLITNYISGDNGTSIYSLFDRLTDPRVASILDNKVDLENLDTLDAIYLLQSINDNLFMYDVVPNLLSKLTSNQSYEIDNIYLDLSNVYYHYYQGGTDYSRHFDNDEIEIVLIIFDEFKSAKEELSELNMKTLNLDLIRTLLIDMNNSEVFHESGPNKASSHYGTFTYSNGKIQTTTETVFQQFIFNVYEKTTLGNQDFRATIDPEYVVRYGGSAYLHKLNNNIIDFRYPWLDEINTLVGRSSDPTCGFLSYVQLLDVFGDDGYVDTGTDKLDGFDPQTLQELFFIINDLNVVPAASRNIMNNLLTVGDAGAKGLGLNKYSKTYFIQPFNESGLFSNYKDQGFQYYLELVVPYEAATIKVLTLSGDDITALAKVTYENHETRIDMSNIKCGYTIQFDNMLPATQNPVIYGYIDTLYYLQTQYEMEYYDIVGLRGFLESAWNADEHSYFRFEEGGNSFNDYLETHTTRGILDILNTATMFNKFEYDGYRAKALTMFNLFTYRNKLGGYDLDIHIGKFFSPYDDDLSSIVALEECFDTLVDDATTTAAANWMDTFVLESGLVRTYVDLIHDECFDNVDLTDAEKASLFFSTADFLYNPNQLANKFAKALRAQIEGNEGYSPNAFGDQITAGMLKEISKVALEYADFPVHQVGVVSLGSDVRRDAYFDYPDAFRDQYLNDFALMHDEQFIEDVIAMNTVCRYLSKTNALTATEQDLVKGYLNTIEQHYRADDYCFLDHYYVAYIYDRQVIRTNYFYNQLDNVYTDLPDTRRSGTTLNQIAGNLVSFSYSQVANCVNR